MNIENLDSDLANTAEEIHGSPIIVGGITFLVKGFNESNRDFAKVSTKFSDTNDVTGASIIANHLTDILVDAVVTGWENMTAGGEPVEYSPGVARSIFDTHPRLATAVFNEASKLGADESEQLSEDQDNLGN